jgi:hypothetical protein
MAETMINAPPANQLLCHIMTEQKSSSGVRFEYSLRCENCGNEDEFVQIASFEAHLVNRHLVYRRLLHSEIDHWECFFCHTHIAPDDYKIQE